MSEDEKAKWAKARNELQHMKKTTFPNVDFGRKGVGYLTVQCHTKLPFPPKYIFLM